MQSISKDCHLLLSKHCKIFRNIWTIFPNIFTSSFQNIFSFVNLTIGASLLDPPILFWKILCLVFQSNAPIFLTASVFFCCRGENDFRLLPPTYCQQPSGDFEQLDSLGTLALPALMGLNFRFCVSQLWEWEMNTWVILGQVQGRGQERQRKEQEVSRPTEKISDCKTERNPVANWKKSGCRNKRNLVALWKKSCCQVKEIYLQIGEISFHLKVVPARPLECKQRDSEDAQGPVQQSSHSHYMLWIFHKYVRIFQEYPMAKKTVNNISCGDHM